MMTRPTHLAVAEDFVLYSDGGGERAAVAGAACIVDFPRKSLRLKYIALIGGATNNEAEITAGLLGFAVIHALRETGEASGNHIRWVADSEYVLKSATDYILAWQQNGWKTSAKKPVKNQGLWRAYLEFSRDLNVRPSHIRGHTGHAENEACDSASTWIQQEGMNLLDTSSGPVWLVDIARGEVGRGWRVVDCRSFLESLREDQSAPEVVRALVDLVKAIPAHSGDRVSKSSSPKKEDGLIARVKELETIAKNIGRSSAEHAELVRELTDIVNRFRKPESS